jgi:hypothetical protein
MFLAMTIGIIFFLSSAKETVRSFESRSYQNKIAYGAQGAFDFIMNIRANQETKTIDIADVNRAQNQLREISNKKSAVEAWVYRGPDNVGGRTRALLIDKDNSNIMFAGGVAGGLWKSTSAGQYWESVQYYGATTEDFANLAIVSICQAANGDIYFGTGEGFIGNHGTNIATPMILGSGIWKSNDHGQSFAKIASTEPSVDTAFILVNKMAADPINPDIIYAATYKGLKVSENGGSSWNPAPLEVSIYDNRTATDVKIATDGSVIASIGEHCFVKKAGSSVFLEKSGTDNLENPETGHLITTSDVGRMEFAYSPQDPNVVFCAVATHSGQLRNIYKSADGGDNWVVIGKGGSALFQPFGSQGTYDLCIAVNPANNKEVFIGGLDIWFGKAANTGDLFAWSQVTLWNMYELNPLYVHADQHALVFDPKDPQTLFVGSDGGISRGFLGKDGIKYQFKTMNKNYNVTQFYSVAVNSYGFLLGGTQDNGTQLIVEGYGNSDLNGFQMLGGDGGHTVMSQINPAIAYGTIYFGGLWRNNDKDYGDWNTFYNSDLADMAEWSSGNWEPDAQSASFVTPITYWETDNDALGIDTVKFIAKKRYPKDTTVVFPSYNINKAPIILTMDKTYEEGDTINYRDNYRALFALGMKREVWLTPYAANWNKTLTQKDWWRALKKNTMGTEEYVTQLKFSMDGNNLFFSTSENEIYRLSNLNAARKYTDADYLFGKPITVLTKIGGFGSRTITGIACDPNNPDNLIITLGNYGNESYLYLTTQATTIAASGSFSNFTDITGNIPKVPVYCALFELDKVKSTVIIGTDMGTFKTTNIFSQVTSGSSINWESYQEGVGAAPVFQITQLNMPNWNGSNYGKIYIGTHGRGFFEDRNYVGIPELDGSGKTGLTKKIALNVYPNPVFEELNLSFTLIEGAPVKIEVIQMNGQIVKTADLGNRWKGQNSITLKINELQQGTYLLTVHSGGHRGTTRFIKK